MEQNNASQTPSVEKSKLVSPDWVEKNLPCLIGCMEEAEARRMADPRGIERNRRLQEEMADIRRRFPLRTAQPANAPAGPPEPRREAPGLLTPEEVANSIWNCGFFTEEEARHLTETPRTSLTISCLGDEPLRIPYNPDPPKRG